MTTCNDEVPPDEKKDWRECVALRAEISQLRAERKLLLQLASAAALLVRDLDEDSYESYESAELLFELLQQIPKQTTEEAPYWWPHQAHPAHS